jgi:glutamate 5-kinase
VSTTDLRKEHVCRADRVVVKVGTNVLAAPGKPLDDERVRAIAEQVAWLKESGRQVVLVSSGAIGCGMSALGIETRPAQLPMLQAIASVGQGKLIARYERHFRRHGLHAAQVLLTREDVDDRRRYLNACNTIHELMDMPCVPVINENDTISTEEICLGDNDALAALVTNMIRARLLVLLTSVPGLYSEPPADDVTPDVLRMVDYGDNEVDGLVYDEKTAGGTGGMASKLEAVRMATSAGEAAVIADGRDPRVLRKLFAGEDQGTLFLPASTRLKSYKRWLGMTVRPCGTVVVDAGAERALVQRGKSLLPSGVTRVRGEFSPGDVIAVEGADGNELARGLANYSSRDIMRIKGARTSELESILGRKDYDEIIHRDNMALVNGD